jgi:hypothetical protein
VPAQCRGDQVDHRDSREPARKGERLDANDRQRQQDADHGAEARAGRDAENVGRHERVAKERLVGGAGAGQGRADHEPGHDPRQADAAERDLARRGQAGLETEGAQDRVGDVGKVQRIGADRERQRKGRPEQDHEQQKGPAPHRLTAHTADRGRRRPCNPRPRPDTGAAGAVVATVATVATVAALPSAMSIPHISRILL